MAAPSGPTTAPITIDELDQQYIRALNYGGNGVGKSIFTCTSQTMRTFMFDVDDGAISVKAYLKRNQLRTDMVHIWKTATYADFLNGFRYLINNIKNYDLAVLDTSTELQQYMLTELRAAAKVQVADQRIWGIAFTQMEEIARSFRHLPIHVIWTAHEKEKQNEYYRRNEYRANFQGQFGDYYGKHFSEIWRYCIFEQVIPATGPDKKPELKITRALKCNKDQFQDAKDRSQGLAEYEHPDIDKIFEKMIWSINNNPDVNMAPEGE